MTSPPASPSLPHERSELQHEEQQRSSDQTEKVTELCRRLKCELLQANGQRILGPPSDWVGPPPLKGSEVFVGRLPRDLLEDELVPVFERIGKIYQVRIMMDFSGFNRGYGFVEFANKEEADRAIKELNNLEIRRNHRIGVVRSVDNCRLFFGGIPRNFTKADIFEKVNNLVPNVKDVILYTSADDLSQNRGFCFVEFNDHKSAAMARRNLIPIRNELFNVQLNIDWAVPEPEIDEETMKTVKNLYVRNLTANITEDQLLNLFDSVNPGCVERVVIKRHYAFVNFHTREDALKAIEVLDDSYLDGAKIQVTLAKPAAQYAQEKSRHSAPCVDDMVRKQYDTSGMSMFLQRNTRSGAPHRERDYHPGVSSDRRSSKYDLMFPPPVDSLYGRMVSSSPRPTFTQSETRRTTQNWQQSKIGMNGKYTELLERLCETLSAGEPRFNLFTMPKKGKTGKDINYYIYEVSIPRWGNGRWLHPPHLMDSEMAAKELAAQFAVFRITCPMMEDQEIAMEMLKCGVLAQVEVPDTHAVSPNLHQSKTRYEELGNQQLRCNSSSGISSFKSAGSGSSISPQSRNRLNPSAPEFVIDQNYMRSFPPPGYVMQQERNFHSVSGQIAGCSPTPGSAGPMQSFFYPQTSPPSFPPPPSVWQSPNSLNSAMMNLSCGEAGSDSAPVNLPFGKAKVPVPSYSA